MRRIFLLLVTTALVIAACGDSGGEDATTEAPPPTATTATPATTGAPTTTGTPPPVTEATTTTAPPTTTTTTVPPGLAVEIETDGADLDDAPFVTAGQAVGAGFACSAGMRTIEDYERDAIRMQESWNGVYVCDDNSGSFTLHIDLSYSVEPPVAWEWGDWSVIGGTGSYAGLTGSGESNVRCERVEDGTNVCHEDHDGHVELPPGLVVEIDVEAAVVDRVVSGTFAAAGPAVDAGFVCLEGTYSQADAVDDMQKQTSTWKGVYVCSDGSGSFTLDVATLFTPGETLYHFGDWSVLEGTDAYVGLTGSGSVYVECVDRDSPRCHEDNDGRVELTE